MNSPKFPIVDFTPFSPGLIVQIRSRREELLTQYREKSVKSPTRVRATNSVETTKPSKAPNVKLPEGLDEATRLMVMNALKKMK